MQWEDLHKERSPQTQMNAIRLQDILTNYERVADHCSNIAVAVLELTHGSFETHAYLNRVRDERDSAFTAQYEKDRRSYGLESV